MNTVVVIGRPNVGKSTLVNRILGRRVSIIEEVPGVTRDRLEYHTEWNRKAFKLIDTGGWLQSKDILEKKISKQVEIALKEADLILFVVDGTVGITDEDDRVAKLVKPLKKKVILVTNKIDTPKFENSKWEFARLGFDNIFAVSALHGFNVGDLLDEIVKDFKEDLLDDASEINDTIGTNHTADETPVIKLAIVGQPNVGKSTLFNQLINSERSIVHDLPGTTTDTVDTQLETPFGTVLLLDTAGIRRKSRVSDNLEYYSVSKALKAIEQADIVFFVLDATKGVTNQDQRLAERIDFVGSPIVVILNKWDLVDSEQKKAVELEVKSKLAFLGELQIIRTAATVGKNVNKLIPSLQRTLDSYRLRIPTNVLNKFILAAQSKHPPQQGKILYAVQGDINPPTFLLFVNRKLQTNYLRYIENSMKDEFDLKNSPIKIRVKIR